MWRSVELIHGKSLGYCLAYGICNHFIIARNIPTYGFLDSLLRTLLTYLDKINHFHLCVTTVFALISASFPAVSLTWLSFPLHNELAEGKTIFHTSVSLQQNDVPSSQGPSDYLPGCLGGFLVGEELLKSGMLWDQDSTGCWDFFIFLRRFIVWFLYFGKLRFSLLATRCVGK